MTKLKNKNYMFFLYLFVSVLSSCIDLAFFSIFEHVFHFSILIATILARVISSLFNYWMNRDKVFKSKEGKGKTFISYYTLVIIQMFVSGLIVTCLHQIIRIDPVFIKVPVELVIFLVNYLIQKYIIFKSK